MPIDLLIQSLVLLLQWQYFFNSLVVSVQIIHSSISFTRNHDLVAQAVGFVQWRYFFNSPKFVSGQVKYECGKWYAYIVYELEIPDQVHLLNEEVWIGIADRLNCQTRRYITS